MRLVLNKKFGGFHLPQAYADAHGLRSVYDYLDVSREDEELITIVESNEYKGDLRVVEIPDYCTDWEIDNYDGMESIIYIVDGKIRHA